MNPKDGVKLSGEDDRQFDLLVDGELGEEDRRALLGRLDGEPGGWRRCALAFLEAQAWKREFATLLRPAQSGRAARGQSADHGQPAVREPQLVEHSCGHDVGRGRQFLDRAGARCAFE